MRREARSRARARGVSLVELIVAMVLLAIIAGVAVFFLLPIRQATDVTVRAELTDTADNALQRIGRELRLALPNSIRVSGQNVEFLPVVVGGRYRAEGYGSGAPILPTCPGGADDDRLAFGTADACFKTIGALAGPVAIGHRLVLNNYGENFPGQDAYEDPNPNQNWRILTDAASGDGRIEFNSATFDRTLHDSPGRRYYVVSDPVTFSCGMPGELRRHSAYPIQQTQPTFVGGGDLLAGNVSRCVFEYQPNVAPAIGLLTLRLALSKPLSGGGVETIELVHAIHVRNVP